MAGEFLNLFTPQFNAQPGLPTGGALGDILTQQQQRLGTLRGAFPPLPTPQAPQGAPGQANPAITGLAAAQQATPQLALADLIRFNALNPVPGIAASPFAGAQTLTPEQELQLRQAAVGRSPVDINRELQQFITASTE